MNSRDVRRWTVRLGLLGLASTFLLGCPERADEITQSASQPSFDFAVARVFSPPGGPVTVDQLTIADIDLQVLDAFARSGAVEDLEYVDDIADEPRLNQTHGDDTGFIGCDTEDGTCFGWRARIDNGSEDTRLPALQDADATSPLVSNDVVIFSSASGLAGTADVILFQVDGLQPSTLYTITLERLGLNVNEGLDTENEILDNAVFGALQRTADAPDELVSLGGSPGTTLGSNPYEITSFTTDATGSVGGFTVFVGFDGGDNQSVVETNYPESFGANQYNYLVVYEGAPAAGVPVVRSQIGVDVDPATGDPINNAYGPFPTSPFGIQEMVAAPGGAGRPDSVSVTFSNLEALTGGAQYTAWLLNPETGGMISAEGVYNRIKIVAERDPISGQIVSTRDSIVETVSDVFAFTGGNEEDGFRHEMIVSDALLNGGAEDTVGFYTYLLLSIDENPGDASPGQNVQLWHQFTDQGGTPTNFFDDAFIDAVTTFGNFDPTNIEAERVYNGSGFGTGGFRQQEMSVDMQALSRPPVGFELVGWLVRDNGTAFRLPPITSPPPARIDLTDADVNTDPDVVTQNGILQANFRVLSNEAGINFANFARFVVTLEAKDGISEIGPVPVYQGDVPEKVRSSGG